MTAKLQDMMLVVGVMVTGSVDAANQMTIDSTDFSLLTCVPPASAGAEIVDAEGDIDLRQMAGGNGFTGGTDIYFVLDGTITGPTGETFPIFFEPPASKAVTITVVDASDPGVNPILPGTGDTSVLLLDDLDRSNERYDYTLHVQSYVNSGQPARGTIDPAIINRGGTIG